MSYIVRCSPSEYIITQGDIVVARFTTLAEVEAWINADIAARNQPKIAFFDGGGVPQATNVRGLSNKELFDKDSPVPQVVKNG